MSDERGQRAEGLRKSAPTGTRRLAGLSRRLVAQACRAGLSRRLVAQAWLAGLSRRLATYAAVMIKVGHASLAGRAVVCGVLVVGRARVGSPYTTAHAKYLAALVNVLHARQRLPLAQLLRHQLWQREASLRAPLERARIAEEEPEQADQRE